MHMREKANINPDSDYEVIRDTLTLEKIYFSPGSHYIWRGYSCIDELKPSFARIHQNKFNLLEEIKQVYKSFLAENKLGNYPFPMPRIFERGIFDKDFDIKARNIQRYPSSDKDLLQVLSFIQHKYGGTSLIDFSDNFLKALFFAVGKREDWEKSDSHLLGIDKLYFSDAKHRNRKQFPFDIYWPSYYLNTRIQHQEGLFIYQVFDTSKGNEQPYQNIMDLLKGEEKNFSWKEIKIENIIEDNKNGGHNHSIAYCDITIPIEQKHPISNFLSEIGITSEYIFCTAVL